jgi:hypothetical protein
MHPIRWEKNTAVFTRRDVDLFGMPDLFGYDDYIVTSTYEDECPFVMDWAMENERRGSTRPVHRYSRVERFVSVLYQLLGERGDIPNEVVVAVKSVGYDPEPERIWNSIRAVLKTAGWSCYYNRIPGIIELLGEGRGRFDFWKIELIKEKFRGMSCRFDFLEKSSRKYFPNLRYVALRLLDEEGIKFAYKIPWIRTKRKEKVMEDIFELLTLP